jgi:hypothetical protein
VPIEEKPDPARYRAGTAGHPEREPRRSYHGPRQAGKSTLARQLQAAGVVPTYFTLDDEATRNAADGSQLVAVSCTPARTCMAVGYSITPTGTGHNIGGDIFRALAVSYTP